MKNSNQNNLPLVVGYRHTGIITKNIEEPLNIYKNILGFERIQDFQESGYYISTITGLNNATFIFINYVHKMEGLLNY